MNIIVHSLVGTNKRPPRARAHAKRFANIFMLAMFRQDCWYWIILLQIQINCTKSWIFPKRKTKERSIKFKLLPLQTNWHHFETDSFFPSNYFPQSEPHMWSLHCLPLHAEQIRGAAGCMCCHLPDVQGDVPYYILLCRTLVVSVRLASSRAPAP